MSASGGVGFSTATGVVVGGASLEQDLAGREAAGARLVWAGGLILAVAVIMAVAWAWLSYYAGSWEVLETIKSIHVPEGVRLAGPTGGGAVAPAFAEVTKQITGLLTGALPKAMAVMMLLMGGIVAVTKQQVTPALSSVMGATVLLVGPSMVTGILEGSGGDERAEIAIVAFEKDHDLGRLASALKAANVNAAAAGYVLSQAMVLRGEVGETGPGSEFYGAVAATLEKGVPEDIQGASAPVRALLERLAFGRAVSAQARGGEENHALARRLSEKTLIWSAGLAVDVMAGVLLIAMGLTVAAKVKRVRGVTVAYAEAEALPDEVPDFTRDGSKHIEHMVEMLEKTRG